MTYVIALPCVDLKDRACIDECPVDCIYEGDRMLYIHPDECVDCGACEPVCPVEAIYYEDDLPEKWADYYKANRELLHSGRVVRVDHPEAETLVHGVVAQDGSRARQRASSIICTAPMHAACVPSAQRITVPASM